MTSIQDVGQLRVCVGVRIYILAYICEGGKVK